MAPNTMPMPPANVSVSNMGVVLHEPDSPGIWVDAPLESKNPKPFIFNNLAMVVCICSLLLSFLCMLVSIDTRSKWPHGTVVDIERYRTPHWLSGENRYQTDDESMRYCKVTVIVSGGAVEVVDKLSGTLGDMLHIGDKFPPVDEPTK